MPLQHIAAELDSTQSSPSLRRELLDRAATGLTQLLRARLRPRRASAGRSKSLSARRSGRRRRNGIPPVNLHRVVAAGAATHRNRNRYCGRDRSSGDIGSARAPGRRRLRIRSRTRFDPGQSRRRTTRIRLYRDPGTALGRCRHGAGRCRPPGNHSRTERTGLRRHARREYALGAGRARSLAPRSMLLDSRDRESVSVQATGTGGRNGRRGRVAAVASDRCASIDRHDMA